MEPIQLREGCLLAIGSPLLDITATADEQLLLKYGLKADDAIRAEEKHSNLIEDMIQNYQPVSFTSGGSTGNTVRVFQWLVEKPRIAAFTGCVAKDKFGQILEEKAGEAGVDVKFQYHPTLATGTCAVVITGHNRSLVADLAASSYFSLHQLMENHKSLVDNTQVVYVEGFFLTVSLSSVLHLGQVCSNTRKVFSMNLSAPFLCRDHADKIDTLLPYIDILFGNIEEATALYQTLVSSTESTPEGVNPYEIALWIAKRPKTNTRRERTVVITQGKQPVLLVHNNKLTEFQVNALDPKVVVDTNGAGDAFVGGFLSQMVQQRPLEGCVRCGIYAATEVIQRFGCTFPTKHTFNCI